MQIVVSQHKAIARFSFMHMVAANICTWIDTTVRETQHNFLVTFHHSATADNTETRSHDSQDWNSSSDRTDGELNVRLVHCL